MQNAELLILLLISVAGFGLLARKIRVPDPIVLVLGGLVVSLIPGLPNVELQPDYVFLIVLPPLLYAQAWFTSWKDFCDNIRPITMLPWVPSFPLRMPWPRRPSPKDFGYPSRWSSFWRGKVWSMTPRGWWR
jgi:NhaP-type Na+/H+ or K+/H+ antiporter